MLLALKVLHEKVEAWRMDVASSENESFGRAGQRWIGSRRTRTYFPPFVLPSSSKASWGNCSGLCVADLYAFPSLSLSVHARVQEDKDVI